MKRSPLKRKTPLAQGAPLKTRKPTERKSALSRRAPMKQRRRQASTDARWRSPEYLAWVRSLPCCVCGTTTGVAAHHMIGLWQLGGMGLKAPDSFAMPACDGPGDTCHRRIHNEQALRDRQPGFVRDTISRGVRHFNGEIREALVEAWDFINEKERAA
ncbi:MAG: DUF968 domain-containing protein [Pseudomonadota bacterium]